MHELLWSLFVCVCVGVCGKRKFPFFLDLVSASVFRLRSEQDAINPRTHTSVQRRARARLPRRCQITAAGIKFHSCRETHKGQKKSRQTDKPWVHFYLACIPQLFSLLFFSRYKRLIQLMPVFFLHSSSFLLVFINFASPLSVSTLNNQCWYIANIQLSPSCHLSPGLAYWGRLAQ